MTDHRINLTLHKLDEFLSGEIHEEMNQQLRLKTRFETLELKINIAFELLKIGSDRKERK